MPVRVNFLQTPNQSLFVGSDAPREYVRSGQDDFEAGLVRLSVKGLCNYLLEPQTCCEPGPAKQYCIRLPVAKLFNSQFFCGARQDLILYGSSFRVPGCCEPKMTSVAPQTKVEENVVATSKQNGKESNKKNCGSCKSGKKCGCTKKVCPSPICCADDLVVLARSVRVSGVKPIHEGDCLVYRFMSCDELLAAWALYGIPVHSVIIDGIYADQIKKNKRAPFEVVASNTQNIDAFVQSGEEAQVAGVGPGFCEATDYKIKRHQKKRKHKSRHH